MYGPGLFVPLTDPNGNGLYEGVTTVDRLGPRLVPPGVEPLQFGVRIVQGTGTLLMAAGLLARRATR